MAPVGWRWRQRGVRQSKPLQPSVQVQVSGAMQLPWFAQAKTPSPRKAVPYLQVSSSIFVMLLKLYLACRPDSNFFMIPLGPISTPMPRSGECDRPEKERSRGGKTHVSDAIRVQPINGIFRLFDGLSLTVVQTCVIDVVSLIPFLHATEEAP